MNTGSSLFMLVGATLFLAAFGVPLLISPRAWERRIGWALPQERDLANYLGRSLGGVAMAIIIMSFLAASNPWKYRVVFEMLMEHLEIVPYVLLSSLASWFFPQPPG